MKFAIEHGSPADLSGFATPLRQLGLHHTLPFPKDGHWRCPCRSTESTWPPFWHFEPSTALWLWQSLHPESASICAIYLDTYIYIYISSWGTRPMRIHQHPSTLFSMIFHQTPIFPSKHGSSTPSPEQLLTGALCDAFVHPQDLLLEHCQVWMQICTAKNMCTIRAASCTHTGAGST